MKKEKDKKVIITINDEAPNSNNIPTFTDEALNGKNIPIFTDEG